LADARARPPAAQVALVEIAERQAGQRIDNYLLAALKGVPRSRIYRLLRKGEVRVNNRRVRPDFRLSAGDLVRLPPVRTAAPPPAPLVPESLRTDLLARVLARGRGWLVIDKPAGLAVHGGSGLALGLIEALRAIWPDQDLDLVHRLDRETSGCLLVASSRAALVDLQAQMRAGSLTKTYLVLVAGRWPRGLREVNAPLRKNTLSSGERMVRADATGKAAVTQFRVRSYLPGFTLLEARLDTGRTHQIRVHCQLMGHPIAGDPKYGDRELNRTLRELGCTRLFLHAAALEFRSPEGPAVSCVAPIPQVLEEVLERLAVRAG
jgi:23S rRNA pseudouridine955/2504/2580 synthase